MERTIEVRSDPPGASVYLDREYRGRTPLTIPFHHYGVREVSVRKGGYEPRTQVRGLWPPWYEIFPLDFFFECLFPLTLRDRRTFDFKMEKVQAADTPLGEKERDELLRRAEDLRKGLDE